MDVGQTLADAAHLFASIAAGVLIVQRVLDVILSREAVLARTSRSALNGAS